MTDHKPQATPKKLCVSSDPADKKAELERYASEISELENYLALSAPERLEAHRNIGDVLELAKKLDPENFVNWTIETFRHEREWRCTHMALARRWDDLTQARAWAEGEGSKLATLYSVEGSLELLKAWDAAMGHKTPKTKRSVPKRAKTSVEGDLRLKQSPEQAEIAALTQQLQDQSDEAAHFRIPLPVDIRSEARTLAVRACAHDAEAERRLRDIACEHRWLFRDLFDDLGPEESGGPDSAARHSSLETPIADQESPASTISETIAHAPKSEESPSDEAGAEREEGDFKGACIAPAAAPDTLGASPRLEDERPQGDEEVHAAKLGNAVPPRPPRLPQDHITIFKIVNGQVEKRHIPVERLPKDRTLIGRQR
jgi:hypothetical protein